MVSPKLLVALVLAAAPALAFDPFEIQVYDGTADGRGEFGLEVHLNRHHDATHLTFEPSFGVTGFWEVGGYLQLEQGRYQGVKLRSKLVAPEGTFEHLRLGLNFEIALEPGGNWGGEIRPILAWEDRHLLLAVNPNLGFPASFEPAAMVKLKLGPVAIGPEYYGSSGGEHYLLGAIDLISVSRLELNFGLGGGSAPVGKMILGYVF